WMKSEPMMDKIGDTRSQRSRSMFTEIFHHDSLFWRKLAYLGAQRMPEWWVKGSPKFFGWAAAFAVPEARKTVLSNLHRIRGEASLLRDTSDTLKTFATYAECLAEALSAGSKNSRLPDYEIIGEEHFVAATQKNKGVIVVTLHTAGWEIAGPLFSQHHQLD